MYLSEILKEGDTELFLSALSDKDRNKSINVIDTIINT